MSLRRRWESGDVGDWMVYVFLAGLIAFIAWIYVDYFQNEDADPVPPVRAAPCSGLQGADLDACLDNEFADDFAEDPREPFGGGSP